ncbi:MAG: ATP phosphoribosyltransferase, partial [Dehalococcoidia bacterium]
MAESTNGRSNGGLRIAIPSDGDMYEPTLRFLAECGMPVNRPSARRYTASIPAIPGSEVIFQRTADITAKVEDGNADLGIVGYDRFTENRVEGGESLLIMPALGFGKCELVVAVPDAWVDVDSMADLADLAVEFRESGRELRVATKYPRLVQRFLFRHGVNYFSLASVTGTLEAAPAMGYADFIVDLTASGVTLRENHLKRLDDGTVLESQGALVGNRR